MRCSSSTGRPAMCIPAWTVRMRSGYATCCSPRHRWCSRRSTALRLAHCRRPRRSTNPNRGRRRPRQSCRPTCRCSFPRNCDGWTRTPTKRPPMTSTSRMPRTTTTSRPIGRPRAGGAAAVVAVAGDVASRPDPTAPRTPGTQAKPTTATSRIPMTAIPTRMPMATTRTARKRPVTSAVAVVGAANPARAPTTTRVPRPTIRPTPWCMSGRHAPANPVMAAPAVAPAARSKASTGPPGWRPSASAAGMGVTPDGGAHRY